LTWILDPKEIGDKNYLAWTFLSNSDGERINGRTEFVTVPDFGCVQHELKG
jgi:hypothetical protein